MTGVLAPFMPSLLIGIVNEEVQMVVPSNVAMGTGLYFTAMTDKGIDKGIDLQYSVTDRTLQLYLCIGQEDNRVLINGTLPLSRQAAVLEAIDQFGKWGQIIPVWMVSERNGALVARTRPINYKTHVKPYYGLLRISQIRADQPSMTYPGNGIGRLLTKRINNRYYFRYGLTLETDDRMRGFDCTSFPMALLEIPYLPLPGYGKQLCEAARAITCDLEQVKSEDFRKKFRENTISNGIYILFSAGHVMLYNADINILYEFNIGGFRATPAGDRDLPAPQNLWWMRRLDEKYRLAFG